MAISASDVQSSDGSCVFKDELLVNDHHPPNRAFPLV